MEAAKATRQSPPRWYSFKNGGSCHFLGRDQPPAPVWRGIGGRRYWVLGSPQVVGDDLGAGLDKLLLRFGERVGKVAFDIELTCKLLLCEDGDNDFRFHHRRARKISRIRGDVLHDHDLATGGRRAAESSGERNASVGRKTADERSDDQIARVRRIDQIKPHPVVACHLLVKVLGDLLHKGLGRSTGSGNLLEFQKKLFLQRRHG